MRGETMIRKKSGTEPKEEDGRSGRRTSTSAACWPRHIDPAHHKNHPLLFLFFSFMFIIFVMILIILAIFTLFTFKFDPDGWRHGISRQGATAGHIISPRTRTPSGSALVVHSLFLVIVSPEEKIKVWYYLISLVRWCFSVGFQCEPPPLLPHFIFLCLYRNQTLLNWTLYTDFPFVVVVIELSVLLSSSCIILFYFFLSLFFFLLQNYDGPCAELDPVETPL